MQRDHRAGDGDEVVVALRRGHEPVAEPQPGPPLRRREATDHQAFVSTMTGITRSVFSWYSLKFGMSAAC